jgi:signal peptidase II
VSHPRPARVVLVLLTVVALGVVVIDQLSKAWVVSALPEGQDIAIIPGVLYFHFVRNSGAAFSMAAGSTWIFSLLALTIAVLILVFARRIRSIAWACVGGLLLGGTLGNLTDRLTRESAPGEVVPGLGHVIDFISTPWMMPAVYNVADMAIVSSMVLLVLLTLRGVRLDGTRATRPTTPVSDGN